MSESELSLEERLEAAACLPPGDPAAQEAAAAAVEAGMEVRWHELQAESAAWRDQLAPDDDDAELRADLLAATVGTGRPVIRWVLAVTAAAAVLLACGIRLADPGSGRNARLVDLAELALDNHLQGRESGWVKGGGPVLEDALSAQLGFAVVVPDVFTQVDAGRRCSLEDQPVAWICGVAANGRSCSVFQFRPGDFGVAEAYESDTVVVSPPGSSPFEIRLWADAGRGYALVMAR